jgi:hypothetical protein
MTKATSNKGKGFKPSESQREAVVALASARLSHEKIATCIFNPNTGKPISKTTLYRRFQDELDKGMYDPVCQAVLLLVREMKKGGLAGVMAAGEILESHEKRRRAEMDSEAQVH